DNIIRRAYALAVTELEGQPQRAITIDEEHLTRALAYASQHTEALVAPRALTYESQHDEPRVRASIAAAAAAFLAEAKRRRSEGGALDLDLADAFKGFVLAVALEDDRDRDKVFQLFGKQALIKSRNHHKVLRREIERADAVCQELSGT